MQSTWERTLRSSSKQRPVTIEERVCERPAAVRLPSRSADPAALAACGPSSVVSFPALRALPRTAPAGRATTKPHLPLAAGRYFGKLFIDSPRPDCSPRPRQKQSRRGEK